MPKASKSKPATQPKPPKPVLSSAAKAARHAHATDYKNAKASTISSALTKPRYHDNDDNDDNDDDDNNNGENSREEGGDGGGEGDADEADNNNEEVVEFEAPKVPPYKSKCGKFIFIPDENGEYIKFTMLNRPEGKLKGLTTLMELDGRENKELLKGIQSTIRTLTLHVARNIPNCTYPKLADEQRTFINIQARNKYPLLARFHNNWVTKEFIIRSLTNKRDHQARIKKAGGQAAWCDQLKAQCEEKKANKSSKSKANGSKAKEKGKEQLEPGPSNSTNQAEGSSKPLNKGKRPREVTPDKSDSEAEAITAPEASVSRRKALRRIESEDEPSSNEEPIPAPKPSSSKSELDGIKASKPAPKSTTPTKDSEVAENNVDPTPTPKPVTLKRKAEDVEAPNHVQKRTRVQPIAAPEEEATSNYEPTPAPEPSVLKVKAKAKAEAKAKAKAMAAAAEAAAAEAQLESELESQEVEPEVQVMAEAEAEAEAEVEAETTAEAERAVLKYRPVSSTLASSTPAPSTDDDTGSTQNTEVYPPTIVSRTPPRVVSPPPTALPSNKEPTVDVGKRKDKMASTNNPTAAKPKANTKNTGKVPPPTKKSQLVLQPATPDPAALDSSAAQATQVPTKKNTKAGRRAKQELIDNTDGLLGTPIPTSPKRLTRGRARGTRA